MGVECCGRPIFPPGPELGVASLFSSSERGSWLVIAKKLGLKAFFASLESLAQTSSCGWHGPGGKTMSNFTVHPEEEEDSCPCFRIV